MGYHKPKGSIIITNYGSLSRDPDLADNPEEFSLGRWIQNPDLPLPSSGVGRRACPGKYFALNSVPIAISQILWAYNIRSVDDSEANATRSRPMGAINLAVPFQASFEPRSPKHQEVIEKEYGLAVKDQAMILSRIGAEFSMT
jgi:cytochrome P450